jgi:hypothetical protein
LHLFYMILDKKGEPLWGMGRTLGSLILFFGNM